MDTLVVSAIAAFAVIVSSVGAAALSPLFYRRQMQREVQRDREKRTDEVRREVYEDYLGEFVAIFETISKKKTPNMTKVTAAHWRFARKAPLLASKRVLEAVAKLRGRNEKDLADNPNIILEDLLRVIGAIRRDFGYEPSPRTSELIARLWLTDMDEQSELIDRLRRLDE